MDRGRFKFYQLSHSDEIEIWKDCIFVFDTSTLLDFYYFSSEALDDIFTNIFDKVKDQLWIPQHVEYEYLKNRIRTLNQPIKKYDPLQKGLKTIDSALMGIKNQVIELGNTTKNKEQHPFLSDNGIVINNLLEKIELLTQDFEQFKKQVTDDFAKRIQEIKSLEKNDKVLEHFENYFKVGREYSFDELMNIALEGEKRFVSKIPPGYMDAIGSEAKEGLQKYGDLIIWNQIIEIARIVGKPVIFILNDNKEDWCHKDTKEKGRIDSPREELVKEIKDKANVRLWMYSLAQFLYKSKELLNTSLKQTSLDEAIHVQYMDEKEEDYREDIEIYTSLLTKSNESLLSHFENLETLSDENKREIRRNKKGIEDNIIDIRDALRALDSFTKHFSIDQLYSLGSSIFKLLQIVKPKMYIEKIGIYTLCLQSEDDIQTITEKTLQLFDEIYKEILREV